MLVGHLVSFYLNELAHKLVCANIVDIFVMNESLKPLLSGICASAGAPVSGVASELAMAVTSQYPPTFFSNEKRLGEMAADAAEVASRWDDLGKLAGTIRRSKDLLKELPAPDGWSPLKCLLPRPNLESLLWAARRA